MTLRSLQRISVLVSHSVLISSGYNVIDIQRSKNNFVIKSLHVDDLLIARNGVELLDKAKDLVII